MCDVGVLGACAERVRHAVRSKSKKFGSFLRHSKTVQMANWSRKTFADTCHHILESEQRI